MSQSTLLPSSPAHFSPHDFHTNASFASKPNFRSDEAMNAWSLLHSHTLMATPIPPPPLMSPDRLIAFSWYPTSSTPTWAAWRTTSITSRSACCRGATRYDFQHLFRTDSRYKRALYQSRFSYSCTCARSICLWKIRLQALHEYVSIFFPNSCHIFLPRKTPFFCTPYFEHPMTMPSRQ